MDQQNALVVADAPDAASLTALIDRAANALAGARNSAEILSAQALASVAYDVARHVSRFAMAKNAADDLIAAAHRAMADSIAIECAAQTRLAQEYDRAKDAGEFGRKATATLKAAGISTTQLYRARRVRAAETAQPGLVQRALDDALAHGQEPLKSVVANAIRAATATPKAPSASQPNALTPIETCRLRVRNLVSAALRQMSREAQIKLLGELDDEVRKLRRRFVDHPKMS